MLYLPYTDKELGRVGAAFPVMVVRGMGWDGVWKEGSASTAYTPLSVARSISRETRARERLLVPGNNAKSRSY